MLGKGWGGWLGGRWFDGGMVRTLLPLLLGSMILVEGVCLMNDMIYGVNCRYGWDGAGWD